MKHLGSFGAAVKELDPSADPDTFDFFGEKFEVVGILPPMLMLQLGASATGKIDEQEGLGAMWEAMRCCLTAPEDVNPVTGQPVPADSSQFDRLYKLAVARNCNLEELIRLSMSLFEAQSGHPTEEPQGSSPGPSSTSPSSSDSSSAFPVSMPQAETRPPTLDRRWPEGMTPVADLLPQRSGSPAYPGA